MFTLWGFCTASFNMEDRAAGQFEFVLGVNKDSAKAFEPRISRSNFILIQTPPF